VYTLGEVLNFDLPYIAGYQGSVDAVLNYALYSSLRSAFQSGGPMTSFESYYEAAYSTWSDITIVGNFVNNHDNPRFLADSNNIQGFKSALAFSLCSVGIPIVYYGDEQGFNGGADPANRETLWENMRTESETYHFLKTMNTFRKNSQFYAFDQIQRYSNDAFYAFSRGDYFFAFTNSLDTQSRSINFHSYPEGTLLCNIFYEKDCVEVKNGEFPIVLINGEVKILVPSQSDQEKAQKVDSWKEKIATWSSTFAFEMLNSEPY
jgi:alpha-amylase